MTKQATIISTRQPAGGEICFQFRDFSPGIPGLPMTDFYKALNMSQIQHQALLSFLAKRSLWETKNEEKSLTIGTDFSVVPPANDRFIIRP